MDLCIYICIYIGRYGFIMKCGKSQGRLSCLANCDVSGLEWDTVFLVQCNEMVMPLQRPSMAKLPVADSFDQTERKERINRKKTRTDILHLLFRYV